MLNFSIYNYKLCQCWIYNLLHMDLLQVGIIDFNCNTMVSITAKINNFKIIELLSVFF